jgi:hypothetical protein
MFARLPKHGNSPNSYRWLNLRVISTRWRLKFGAMICMAKKGYPECLIPWSTTWLWLQCMIGKWWPVSYFAITSLAWFRFTTEFNSTLLVIHCCYWVHSLFDLLALHNSIAHYILYVAANCISLLTVCAHCNFWISVDVLQLKAHQSSPLAKTWSGMATRVVAADVE